MIYGIIFVTGVSWFRHTKVTAFPDTSEGDAAFHYFKKVVDVHTIKSTAGALSFKHVGKGSFWEALVTFLYVDILDTTGTLYSMARFAGFVDENGDFEGQYFAFMSDATAIVVGSLLGTSPVTAFIESSTGIREGGRTGMTALTTGAYFFLALFITPILASIPAWAVGPPLILVGVLMMKSVDEIDWHDMKQAIPAFITLIVMPLTYSIAYGLIGGIGTYIVLHLWDWGLEALGILGIIKGYEGKWGIKADDEENNGGNKNDGSAVDGNGMSLGQQLQINICVNACELNSGKGKRKGGQYGELNLICGMRCCIMLSTKKSSMLHLKQRRILEERKILEDAEVIESTMEAIGRATYAIGSGVGMVGSGIGAGISAGVGIVRTGLGAVGNGLSKAGRLMGKTITGHSGGSKRGSSSTLVNSVQKNGDMKPLQ
ncbi:hypothetical protein Ancab_034571 [Ancistrocladus abbreviatus]